MRWRHTDRHYMRIPPVSGLGVSWWNSQSVCVILEARPHSPAGNTNTAAVLKKYMANMDVMGKGGREPGGVWWLKEDQGRARNRCSSYAVLAFKALVGLFQDGLSVESDAHFHSGVLDLMLAQVVPRIPGLFPLWLQCELAGEAITVPENAGLLILLLSTMFLTAPSGRGFHGISPNTFTWKFEVLLQVFWQNLSKRDFNAIEFLLLSHLSLKEPQIELFNCI